MVNTTVHWHAHAVGALCFSLDAKFLLSGGQEAVLVSPFFVCSVSSIQFNVSATGLCLEQPPLHM